MDSPRQIKADKVSSFQDQISEAKAIVLAEYKGLTVHEMEALRSKVREIGGRVIVIKNTLAKVALNKLGIEDLDGDLTGQIAFVFSNVDAVMGTKVANSLARANKNFKLVSGFFDGRRISLDEVRELASMPSREELQSRFVGILMAPMAEYVGTLVAPLQEFLATLDARSAKLDESEEALAA